DLETLGFQLNLLASLRIEDGYLLEVFSGDNFDGVKTTFENSLETFNDNAASIIVRRKGISIDEGIYAIQNNQSKLFLSVEGNSLQNNALLVQKSYLNDETQKFQFTHLEDNYYAITNVGSAKEVSIVGMSSDPKTFV